MKPNFILVCLSVGAFVFGDELGDFDGGAKLVYTATEVRNNAKRSAKRFFNS